MSTIIRSRGEDSGSWNGLAALLAILVLTLQVLSGCADSFPSSIRDQTVHAPVDTAHSWTIVTSPTIRDLNAMDAHGSFVAIGGDGVLLLSNDSGNTWKSIATPNQLVVRAIHFFDSQTGVVAGDDTNVYRTTDGAQTWSLSPIAGFGRALSFVDSRLGFLGVDSGKGQLSGIAMKTSDGGITWQAVIRTSSPITALSFLDADRGICATSSGALYFTTNSGTSWDQGICHTIGSITSIVFNSTAALASEAGGSDVVVRSTDGGKNWSPFKSCNFAPAAVSCNGSQAIAIAGSGGQLLQSDDLGAHWLQSNLEAHLWRAAQYLDARQILVCGVGGAIGKRK